MDQDQCRKKLDESRQKLNGIFKQLDVSASGQDKREWRGIHEIVSSVEELQSLISWIIDKRGTKEQGSVISQKLQKLNQIRKVLEKSAYESQNHSWPLMQHQRIQSEQELHESFKYCPDSEKQSKRKMVNFNLPCDSISSTTKSDDAFDFTDCSSEDTLYDQNEERDKSFEMMADKNTKVYINETYTPFQSLNKQRMIRDPEDQPDSLCTAISEDEGLGEESRRGDSTGPNSLLEISDSASDLTFDFTLPPEVFCDQPSDGQHQNSHDWAIDPSQHRNSLELCLATISKLKKALSGKENELLKVQSSRMAEEETSRLKAMVGVLQNEQEDLRGRVNVLEKENESLKEQVLELEEAENDARFKGQHLEEKLVFLQEKDSHFQAELSEAKHSLELCIDELSIKDSEERELQSQLRYMEVLVQKYEDQIQKLEFSESEVKANLKQMEGKHKELVASNDEAKRIAKEVAVYSDLKTFPPIGDTFSATEHSYDFSTDKSIFPLCANESTKTLVMNHEYEFHMIAIPAAFRSPCCDAAVQTNEQLCDPSATENYSTLTCLSCTEKNREGISDTRDLVPVLNCPIQNELLKRLHHLAEEDADLQQQLHQVDQINLTLWQKLHELQFHIGECQKENLSEDEPSSAEDPSDEAIKMPSSVGIVDTRNSSPNSDEILSNYSALFSSEFKDEKLKDKLSHLEGINSSFLKQLDKREQLCVEKERKHTEWIHTEARLTEELNLLKLERESMLTQISQLEAQKFQFIDEVDTLDSKLLIAKEKNEKKLTEVAKERDAVLSDLQKKIDSLLTREKDHMKKIIKLQCGQRKGDEKIEFDTLKQGYVQLQMELEKSRDEMDNMRRDFERQLQRLKERHNLEENRLQQALELLRKRDAECNKKLDEMCSSQKIMESTLARKEKELEDARAQFKVVTQTAEEQHKIVEDDLRGQLLQMEEGTAMATQALTEERMRLEKELQGNIDDLRSKEVTYKTRIQELESNVSQLHTELHRLTGSLRLKCDDEEASSSITSFQRERMLKELHELRVREGELREKLDEMEKKEAAYRETLEHADRIVASVERGYKNKIDELELSERSLKQKVGYLEEVENGLRMALQRERRSSDGRKPEDLIVELNEAEKRENGLKEDLVKLEQSQRNSTQKIKDLEKIRENLELQLSDREDLSISLERIKKEQEVTKKELLAVKKSEGSFQLALEQTENLLKSRDAAMEAEIQRFTDEKKDLEETINQLRDQVRDLMQRLEKNRGVDEHEGDDHVCDYSVVEKSNSPDSFHATFTQECAINPEAIHSSKVRNGESWSTVQKKSPNQTSVADDSRFLNSTTSESANITESSGKSIPFAEDATIKEHNRFDICDKPNQKTNTNYKINGATTCFPEIAVNETPVGFYDTRRTLKAKYTNDIPQFTPAEDIREPMNSSSLTSSDLEPTGADNEYNKVRLHLEQCMLRAMDVMKMEMEQKAGSRSPDNYFPDEYENVMSSPLNFRVVQQVGSDTVLVGWEYLPSSTLVGFEVYVNGELHETVLTPDRRKAVIGDLDLNKPLTLSLYAVSSNGQVSEPQTIYLAAKVKPCDGFFLVEDDDDDEFFDDVSAREIRPCSMDW